MQMIEMGLPAHKCSFMPKIRGKKKKNCFPRTHCHVQYVMCKKTQLRFVHGPDAHPSSFIAENRARGC
jgi:hypothetical protein